MDTLLLHPMTSRVGFDTKAELCGTVETELVRTGQRERNLDEMLGAPRDPDTNVVTVT